MKKAFSISRANGEFCQYLSLSEIRFIKLMCQDFGPIIVEIVEISKEEYKIHFGK